MCKTLFYKISNSKKLDWLKKENSYAFEKINFYFLLLILIVFLISFKFKDLGLFLFMLLGVLGSIANIKNTKNDIESSIMQPMNCMVLILLFTSMIGSFLKLF